MGVLFLFYFLILFWFCFGFIQLFCCRLVQFVFVRGFFLFFLITGQAVLFYISSGMKTTCRVHFLLFLFFSFKQNSCFQILAPSLINLLFDRELYLTKSLSLLIVPVLLISPGVVLKDRKLWCPSKSLIQKTDFETGFHWYLLFYFYFLNQNLSHFLKSLYAIIFISLISFDRSRQVSFTFWFPVMKDTESIFIFSNLCKNHWPINCNLKLVVLL